MTIAVPGIRSSPCDELPLSFKTVPSCSDFPPSITGLPQR
jgi:hypothetical protein